MLGNRIYTAHHFETPKGRARALYRIPTAPNSNRALELCHATESLLQGFAWPGTEALTCELVISDTTEFTNKSNIARPILANIFRPLPFTDCSFDLVILHQTFDRLAESLKNTGQTFEPEHLFGEIFRILAPGGLVAGCIDKRSHLKSFLRWVRRDSNILWNLGPSAHFSQSSLRHLLSSSKFVDVRLFDLLPRSAAPLRLVDSDRTISKLAYRSEIDGGRRSWSLSGYIMRRIAVHTGIYSWLEESVFFWAYKPC